MRPSGIKMNVRMVGALSPLLLAASQALCAAAECCATMYKLDFCTSIGWRWTKIVFGLVLCPSFVVCWNLIRCNDDYENSQRIIVY